MPRKISKTKPQNLLNKRKVKKAAPRKITRKANPSRVSKTGAPYSGEADPCKCCNHGNFCDKDHECLSCGVTRTHKHKPYKGW